MTTVLFHVWFAFGFVLLCMAHGSQLLVQCLIISYYFPSGLDLSSSVASLYANGISTWNRNKCIAACASLFFLILLYLFLYIVFPPFDFCRSFVIVFAFACVFDFLFILLLFAELLWLLLAIDYTFYWYMDNKWNLFVYSTTLHRSTFSSPIVFQQQRGVRASTVSATIEYRWYIRVESSEYLIDWTLG